MNKRFLKITVVMVAMALIQLACAMPRLWSTSEPTGMQNDQQAEAQEQHTAIAIVSNADLATITPTPPVYQNSNSCVNSFSSIADISNAQIFSAQESFNVNWTLTNTGTCAWFAEDKLILLDGDLPATVESVLLGRQVSPGDSINLTGSFTTPAQDGIFQSLWKMETGQGMRFGLAPQGEMPLRIAIKVVAASNPQPQPTTVTPTFPVIAPIANYTLLDDECFDLSNGQVVACSDNRADFKYQYGTLLGGKFYNVNQVSFASNQNNEPEKNDCESLSLFGLPLSLVEGTFFCYQDRSLVSPRYGWVQIKHFNESDVNFNFEWFSYTPAEISGFINPLVMVAEDQATLLIGACFDVHHGTQISCTEPYALLTYEQSTQKGMQVKQIRGMGQAPLLFSIALENEPTKADCENLLAGTSAAVIWPISSTKYYCYEYVPGMAGYSDWIRPTSYNANGMTFDFLTWNTSS